MAATLLAAGCGQSAFDERAGRAWSDSQGPPDGIRSGAYAIAIATVDREQPGATIVVAGSSPFSLSTLSYDVGGELEQRGLEGDDAPDATVLAGALDPVAGGNGVVAIADGAGGIHLYDARTGDLGPALRAALGPTACGGLSGLGSALVFGLTDPGGDVEPDLVALAGAELALFHDLDLDTVAEVPDCSRCRMPAEGASISTVPADDDDGEDIAVLSAGGDQIAVHTAAQVRAQSGQGCGEPALAIAPPDAGDRFAAPLAVGDIEDNAASEIAVSSPDRRVLFVLHDVSSATPDPPSVLRVPAPADSAAFGAAIVFGDFDGDDIEELAVGDPDASPEGVAGAGQVTIYRYDGEELKPSATLYDSEPEEGQHFGRSLTVAEFGLGGAEYRDLLVVGADGEVFTYFRVLADVDDPRN